MSVLGTDPVFGKSSVQLLPGGTLFRVPLPAGRTLALTQMSQGWRIAALVIAPKLQPIVVTHVDGRLSLAAEQPGDVISLADPNSGATLLVGTQHRPGQGVATSRRGAEFVLRATLQGVVVEPLADQIVLKQVPTGFSLTGLTSGLLLSPPTAMTDVLMDAAHLTRRFDFSTMPPDALLRRASRQFDEAAAAPPLARGSKHRATAESLMALGLFAEAGSLLKMASEEDPKEAASPDTGGLTAIAALLASRPEDADALADPRLTGSDEISLWRGISLAMQDHGSPAAAAAFASTGPLIFQYPQAIREHVLPLMIETMIEGGEIASAKRLLDQRKTDPKLAYARGLMQQAEGDTDQALSTLDDLANGRDQFDRARAAVRAVELRLSAHKLDKTQAADELDKLLYVWRGDSRELALRERVAELRGQTGAWPVALTTLRQAEADFPEQALLIHERLKDMFAAMIRDQGEYQTPSIDFVAAVDENADLMPDVGDDDTVQQALADRLLALDLPERAKPVLEKLIKLAKSDEEKARFGFTLAKLNQREGDDVGAQAALVESNGRDLPADLIEQRTILLARTIAKLGDTPGAVAMLAPLHTAPAIQARAEILEAASRWADAEQAWSEDVALTVPPTGQLLEDQMRSVLRLATATARASDDAGLADLRVKYSPRMAASPLADMFRLLTAEPIRTSADIKRSQQEVSLAASLPAGMKAFQAGNPTR
jgi:tetratricopeptide (TPR) repeat protein